MSSQQVNFAEIEALRREIDSLSPDEIRALQAFGIQQAARNGLIRDARLIVIFGILAVVFGLLSPVYSPLKVIQIILALCLIAGAAKAYFRPSIGDMLLMVILLGASVLANAIVGIVNILLFSQPVLAIFLIALAGIKGRWAINLWQAYRVAKQSDADIANYPRIDELYHIAVQILAEAEPRPDNTIVHFGRGHEALRLLPGKRFAMGLRRNGMVQVIQSDSMTMQLAPDSDKNALYVKARLSIKQRELYGDISRISYDNFQQWQKSLS